MSNDPEYYFLSSTAQNIWRSDDTEGQQKMFECLVKTRKDIFFRRVIYKSKKIPEYKLVDIAENVLMATWEAFNKNGRAGKIIFSAKDYTSYLFIAFKNNFLKALERELKYISAEKAFGSLQNSFDEVVHDESRTELFSSKTKMILGSISPDCKQLLIWKHVEGLTHDEIAARKNINRNSSIKMVSRCSRRFFEKWQTSSI